MALLKPLGAVVGAAVGLYAAYATARYVRYGRGTDRSIGASPLDAFLPAWEVREAHRVRVNAPVEVTYAAACELAFEDSPIVRALFAVRTLPSRLSGAAARAPDAGPTIDRMISLGWRVLAEEAGRGLIVGTVTQPWKRSVRFRAIAPEAFAAFADPGYAKIVMSIGAEPLGPESSVFFTETRVATTDESSRARFRPYWALLSPGIVLVRCEMLRLVKRAAERRPRPT